MSAGLKFAGPIYLFDCNNGSSFEPVSLTYEEASLLARGVPTGIEDSGIDSKGFYIKPENSPDKIYITEQDVQNLVWDKKVLEY